MRRGGTALVIAILALTLVTGCSSSDNSGSQQQTKSIDITFSGNTVSPNGERVEVQHGQPIELVVKADHPGEIHVHSTPEQELKYGAGTTTLTVTLKQPGVVDVESHSLDITILQLEVR